MKKILLVYPPFCTPASIPYSITNIYSFLKNNSKHNIKVLDLNLEFHKLKFSKYQKYYQDIKKWDNYNETTKEYNELSRKVYSENNKKIRFNQEPEYLKELLNQINKEKPDIVAFSIVYSSQVFYAYELIKNIKATTIIGGPAINDKLKEVADKVLSNELELLNYINNKQHKENQLNFNYTTDYSIYKLKEYFTPFPVIPIKTSNTCYYKKCTFCTHFTNEKYCEYNLEIIKNNIINSKQKHFFLIDDAITKKRLLEIAKVFKPLKIKWGCQLRPTKELDYQTLKTLQESGLKFVLWGVESVNDRILKLIRKGTNKKDMQKVLEDSHKANIKNVTYVMFGFPSETKEEFLETISFLKENNEYIDLVSLSTFGLQKGTVVYNNPKEFKIKKIIEEERTILEPKITYQLESGLTIEEIKKLKKSYKKTIDNINKYPRMMNFFREHMLCMID